MKKIILNCLPPASIKWPSPALSILKAYLEKNNFEVSVLYWNLIFEPLILKYWWTEKIDVSQEAHRLAPFFNFIAREYKDQSVLMQLLALLHAYKPSYRNEDINIYSKHLDDNARDFEDIIDKNLEKIDFSEVAIVGFQAKLYQWIGANIIAKKIKNKYPHVKIVIGGFGTHKQAIEMLRNYSFYDFALWGEGEWPLTKLCSLIINEESNFDEVPFLIYRKENLICKSPIKNNYYLDLNSNLFPDFTDYFQQIEENAKDTTIVIEGSRGCHWNQCQFCYLNEGYRYRYKKVDSIISELKYQMDKYGTFKVEFLDNDIIGNNLSNFENLLDELINLREQYPKFQIVLAEIISKGLNAGIIKKMSLAGFRYIQIGYESPSNEILKKIHKKNTFASNLLAIKWASYYNISVGGGNVIRNLLEETEEDIMEGIDNLHYMRFIFRNGDFRHLMSYLGITKSSHYFKELESKNLLSDWTAHYFDGLLPKDYFFEESKYDMLLDYMKQSTNKLWDSFKSIENQYIINCYEYNVAKYRDAFIYREIFNKEVVNELHLSNLEWDVLCLCNDKVATLDDIWRVMQKKYSVQSIEQLKEALNDLNAEGLVYMTKDYSEIITVINTLLVN